MKGPRKWLAYTLILVALFLAVPAQAAETGTETVIKVFSTNDVHSRATEYMDEDEGGALTQIGYARFKAYTDAQKADGKLLLDAGDSFHGQPFATICKGSSIAEIMKAVGYDAISPGNHDFNYGLDRMKELETLSGVPFLAANLQQDGKPLFGDYIVKEFNGIKVGIFGLSTQETAYKTNPQHVKAVSFGTNEQVLDTAAALVKTLREKEKVDAVIALTHLGDAATEAINSVELGEKVPGIDLIVDGHSHSSLSGKKAGGAVIVSAGEYLSNFTDVTMTFDKDGKLQITSRLVTCEDVKDLPQDPAILTLIDKVTAEYAPILDSVVSTTPVALDAERGNIRTGSTNMGRLITDAMRSATGAEIALHNAGSIRASIPAGPVTKGQLVTTLPFGDYVLTVKMPGSEILAALNHGMVSGQGSFPQFSGLTVEAAPVEVTKEGGVEKSFQVLTAKVGGQPLDPSREYVVAINEYLYIDGDGYTMFSPHAMLGQYGGTEEILIDYLSKADFTALAENTRLLVKTAPVQTPAPSAPAVPAPEAPSAAAPPPPAAGRTYTVTSGDCLWNISQALLGTGTRWGEIYELNRAFVQNPNAIQVGQTLLIPAA